MIVDEIHSLVPTKRGAQLFLSLERLAAMRPRPAAPLQRLGLSATQRPLEEVARLLGGGEIGVGGDGTFAPRPVEIIDAGGKKEWDLRVEVPVEDMARLGEIEAIPSGPVAGPPKRKSIWPSIHPRLVELIRAHRSTMIFANSRRLAERLAQAINETAGEELALAHHGSIARERRIDIEDRLKKGELPAIVATSSLELGLGLGAIDLVVQIEAPPSIASGLQRIGRAGHSVGAVSRGVIFPKYRGDLLAAAACIARMMAGSVEETFYPRNPLDVLAQQIVAIVSMDEIDVDALYALIRRAAPFAELPRGSFEGVLDMLSGRYPSDEFAELRPLVTWGGCLRDVFDLPGLIDILGQINAPVVELLRAGGAARHPQLRALGPDLLKADFDPDEAKRRLRARGDQTIGEALMAQAALAGIGNVYKSEVLFLLKTSPFARVDALSDATIDALVAKARELMAQNLEGKPRTTRNALSGDRTWVYGRSGMPCYLCRTLVKMRRQGLAGRSTYYCPVCQGAT